MSAIGDMFRRILRLLKEEVPMTHEERVSGLLWSCMSYEEMCERVAELEEFALELFPYVGDTCPEECKFAKECLSDKFNKRGDGLPTECIAYAHYLEKFEDMGIEVE